jgi:RNA polymerase sigma factor (sigma-70 family)
MTKALEDPAVPLRMDGSALRRLEALFEAGAFGVLSDGQLLERAAFGHCKETAELAFTTLVERHGPAVLRVCRAVLRDEHHAHDAFQATFLVLARKARVLRVRGPLGPWLSQVAYRVARGAGAADARRRRLERRYAELAAPGVAAVATNCEWDVGAVVREEVDRLPDGLGVVIRMCDLEGCSHEEAARQLGWPVGTVKSRSARGRARLRDRLARRGLAPAVLPALAREPAWLGPPTWLVEQTVRITWHVATGVGPGLVPESVARLAEGATWMMFVHKVQAMAAAACVIGLGAAGAVAMAPQAVKNSAAVVGRGGQHASAVGGVNASDDPRIAEWFRTVAPAESDERLRSVERLRAAVETARADRDLKDMQRKAAQADLDRAEATLGQLQRDLANAEARSAAGVARPGSTGDPKRMPPARLMPEPGSWGVVTMDLDNDGNLDLFITNAAPSPGASGPGSPTGGGFPGGHLFFKNLGDGTFKLVPMSPDAPPLAETPATPAPSARADMPLSGAGAVVGSVDMSAVFEKLKSARQARREIQADADRDRESLDRLRARLRELDQRRTSKTPDGSDAADLEAEIASLKKLFEDKSERATTELARREARMLAELDTDVREAIAQIARQKGLSYVVKAPSVPAPDASTTDVQAVLNRSVLYADPRTDITDEVVRTLNDRYAPGKPLGR